MAVNREELVTILSIVSFLAHADGEMHPAEKKVLIATFKAISITAAEQKQMKSSASLEVMLKNIKSQEAKNALVELLALVAGADGVFDDEERVVIKKIMKKLEMPKDHPYFSDENLDVPTVRKNVGKILNSLKNLAK